MGRPRAILVLALLVAGCKREAERPGPGVEIRIRGAAVSYGGTALPLGEKLDAWTRVLGPPSRSVDRALGIEVWDDLGLAVTLDASHPPSDPHVGALWIFFARGDADFFPRATVAGKVTFVRPAEGAGLPEAVVALDGNATLDSIKSQGFPWGEYPSMSRYTRLRFGQRSGRAEICFVQSE